MPLFPWFQTRVRNASEMRAVPRASSVTVQSTNARCTATPPRTSPVRVMAQMHCWGFVERVCKGSWQEVMTCLVLREGKGDGWVGRHGKANQMAKSGTQCRIKRSGLGLLEVTASPTAKPGEDEMPDALATCLHWCTGSGHLIVLNHLNLARMSRERPKGRRDLNCARGCVTKGIQSLSLRTYEPDGKALLR